MAVQLNHTIVHAHDKQETARHLVDILGLPEPASFGQIHARIRDRGLEWWADPFHHRPHEVNTNDGGRGLYWNDPNGHSLEILTVPYGGWGR